MASDVGSRLRQAGIDARIAISDTWEASHALARFSADVTTVVATTIESAAKHGFPLPSRRS